MERRSILQHVKCPKCGMENLKGEVICFACGEPMQRRRWRPGNRPLQARRPALLWFALFGLLGLAALLAYQGLLAAEAQLAQLSAEEQERARLWLWSGGGGLLAIAQGVFWWARVKEKEWWHWKRAPRLPMNQVSPGDTVWLTGHIQCGTPLIAPVSCQPCVYYRYREEERTQKGGWRTVKTDKQAVDFSLEQEGNHVYVPSGGVLFDAPFSTRTGGGFGDEYRLTEHALFVKMPASVCGTLAETSKEKRLDAVGNGVPAVVTHQSPNNYLAELAKRVTWSRVGAWAASVAGFFALGVGLMQHI